jgi:hypothetical protein
MTSWTTLTGGAVFAAFSARSWVRAVRYWRDPTVRTSPGPLWRLLGEKGQRRLESGSVLNSVCLSGLTLLFLGGAWLPAAGSPGAMSPVASGVASAGLIVFLLGLVAQFSLVFFGRPSFVIPKHARESGEDQPNRRPG